MIDYLKEKKWIILLLAPLYIVILIYTCYRQDYEIILPGDITPIVDKVTVESNNEQSGSFNSVFVYSLDKTTPFMNKFAKLLYGVVVREMSESYSLLTLDEMRTRGKIYYNTGMQYSLIYAFMNTDKYLEYEFDGVLVSYIYKDVILGDLKIGDKIISVDGNEIDNIEEFIALIDNIGDEATFTTERGDVLLKKNTVKENKVFGFSVRPNYKLISSEPQYKISKTNTQGSSAGLLQTLSIFNQLTETDYTFGLKIAGTGTINEFGYVGPIGAVEQKIITADRNNVDLFFVAKDNYEDAYNMISQINTDMKLVSVEKFSDAISYLMEFGDKNDE
ncbi:S16 family serine protease [Mycoplasmatota bacterium WC44]